MRGCPTIAIARLAATAPIKRTPWVIDADADIEPAIVKQAQEIIDLHRSEILRHALTALDYGFAAFEVEWTRVNGLIVPAAFIPQPPDESQALITEDEPGRLAGAEFGSSRRVPRAKVLWITHDSEATGFYGRSRGENVCTVYAAWIDTLSRVGRYTNKTAGVVPMVEYPEGRSQDRSGRDVDNFEIAEKVLAGLGSGKGVTMPNSLVAWADEAMKRGIDVTSLKAWSIQFLESQPGHGDEYIGIMRYLDSLIMRGWLVPERAATEGQMGTKAEAEAHGDVAASIADQFAGDIVTAVNRYVIEPMLRMNLGLGRERALVLATAPVDREAIAWQRQLMTTVLGTQPNPQLLLSLVQMDALIDATGLPRRAGFDQDETAERLRVEAELVDVEGERAPLSLERR